MTATPSFQALNPLIFSTEFVTATVLKGVDGHYVGAPSIVINAGSVTAWATPGNPGATRSEPLAPFSSTLLTGVQVSGELLIVLEPQDMLDLRRQAHEAGWTDFNEGLPDPRAELLRSPQDTLGRVRLDLSRMLHQPPLAHAPIEAEVRANLWYSPAESDCGIHREHDFIELHTQVIGMGRMQKFAESAHDSIYEDQLMRPGYTNPNPFCYYTAAGEFNYPWHQYRSDTESVWLAIEYHLLS